MTLGARNNIRITGLESRAMKAVQVLPPGFFHFLSLHNLAAAVYPSAMSTVVAAARTESSTPRVRIIAMGLTDPLVVVSPTKLTFTP